jgi:hypothetical protein
MIPGERTNSYTTTGRTMSALGSGWAGDRREASVLDCPYLPDRGDVI